MDSLLIAVVNVLVRSYIDRGKFKMNNNTDTNLVSDLHVNDSFVNQHLHAQVSLNTEQQTPKRGFAAMSPERVRELAARGGRNAHQKGTAYKWNSDTAKVAGSKGGRARSKK